MLRAGWQPDVNSESLIGSPSQRPDAFSQLALTVACATMAAVPWFLGGAIPHAILVLQSGAVCSAALALIGMFLSRRFPTHLPRTSLPLLGFAVIGLLQLLPVYIHPALEMRHSVHPELARELPSTQTDDAARRKNLRSVMPAETRLCISQALSLALIAMTVFETAGTSRRVLWAVSGLVISGCGMTVVALSQNSGALDAAIGNQWKISPTAPFGCFVNPNNAAGWLIICFSGAVMLCSAAYRDEKPQVVRNSVQWSSWRDGLWMSWHRVMRRVANINTLQLLTASSVVLLMSGIAATLSRAGIVAAVIGMAAFVVSRYRSGRFVGTLGGLSFVALLACLFLVLFQLDTVVVSELRTLKDPVSDSTGRLLHWSDSLRSCLDFPVLGSGLGGYRFGSLPYQRHFTGKWFQRADNQYVEVLVESGIAGLICFTGFGIMTLLLVRRVLAGNRRFRRSADGSLTSLLGSSVLFSIVSLAAAAFFDYGIALPSVAGAMVVLIVLLERRKFELRQLALKDNEQDADSPHQPAMTAGPCLAMWMAVIVSAAILLPDTLAATRTYAALVPLRRMLYRTDVKLLSESGDAKLSEAESVLRLRPDDFDGLRVRASYLELLFRNELILRMATDRTLTPAAHINAFRELNPFGLAHRMLNPDVPDAVKLETRNVMQAVLERYPWREADRELLTLSPCVFDIALDLGILETALAADPGLRLPSIRHMQFSEPHNARSLSLFGQVMLMAGRKDECRELWNQSLAVSERYRPQILLNAMLAWGSGEALREFGPRTYESTVITAIGIRTAPELRSSLLEQADQMWSNARTTLSASTAKVRATHLEAVGHVDQAIEWLAKCLADQPKDLPLRKMRARLLEQLGRNRDACDEWRRVLIFDAADSEAPIAMKRLINEPSTDVPR